MKAAYFERHGGPEVIRYGDLPDPEAGLGEIVVDIHAASVNGADCKVLSGRYSRITDFPYVLGRDFSGVVASLGDGVDEFAPGDPVFGVCEVGLEGTYAEKIAVKAALVARKPDSLSYVGAAALALIGLTAVVSIEDTLALRPGETILIQGGAGGVAGFGIQLAKHIGAHVIATCSARNVDYVRGLGADQVIDYNAQDFADVVSDCDAVFETVGGDVAERSFAALKPAGRAAFIASGPTAPEPPCDDVTALRPRVGRDRPRLLRILDLVETGAVRVPEIRTFPLDDAASALATSASRHLRGKLVLKIR
ncbi:MAG: NADP-dependent oxidoreductase [Rhodospirillales bacterium]|nr:NADP-dependent oxidoreductase [Rhodospirillales bacterium]